MAEGSRAVAVEDQQRLLEGEEQLADASLVDGFLTSAFSTRRAGRPVDASELFSSGKQRAAESTPGGEIAPRVCSSKGEDCRGTLCCASEGEQCYEKDAFYAGCRPSCAPYQEEPERPGSGPWTCAQAKRSCACRGECGAEGSCPAFPEVAFLYLPEVPEDVERYEKLAKEYDDYVPCGHEPVRKVPGVNPKLWPKGKGKWDDVEKWAPEIPEMEVGSSIWVGYDEIKIVESSPWYFKHRLIYAEKNDQGESTWGLKGFWHHTGCTLTHFVTWMEARSRGVSHLLISESDGTFSQWWTPYSHGEPSEFSSVVQALLEETPKDWDVIFLDKGKMGVKTGAGPRLKLTRPCWSTPYDLFDWTGEGMAGAALYIVSSRFFEKLPQLIHETGLDMVDAWLGTRCNPEVAGDQPGGQLKCYSVQATSKAKACDRVCVTGGQAATCWKRAWSLAQGPKGCGEANKMVHEQCRQCRDCWLKDNDCSGEASAHDTPILPPSGGGHEGDGGAPAELGPDSAECKLDCFFDGHTATCGARMQYLMEKGTDGAESASCGEALKLVSSQCKECAGCQLSSCPGVGSPGASAAAPQADSGDQATRQESWAFDAASGTWPSAAETAPAPQDAEASYGGVEEMEGASGAPCERDCLFDSQLAKCKDRIKFSAQESGNCGESVLLVQSQCPECAACSMEEAGCST